MIEPFQTDIDGNHSLYIHCTCTAVIMMEWLDSVTSHAAQKQTLCPSRPKSSSSCVDFEDAVGNSWFSHFTSYWLTARLSCFGGKYNYIYLSSFAGTHSAKLIFTLSEPMYKKPRQKQLQLLLCHGEEKLTLVTVDGCD